jgi:hypothetical protein
MFDNFSPIVCALAETFHEGHLESPFKFLHLMRHHSALGSAPLPPQ